MVIYSVDFTFSDMHSTIKEENEQNRLSHEKNTAAQQNPL